MYILQEVISRDILETTIYESMNNSFIYLGIFFPFQIIHLHCFKIKSGLKRNNLEIQVPICLYTSLCIRQLGIPNGKP